MPDEKRQIIVRTRYFFRIQKIKPLGDARTMGSAICCRLLQAGVNARGSYPPKLYLLGRFMVPRGTNLVAE
jgi:hypothetical protein